MGIKVDDICFSHCLVCIRAKRSAGVEIHFEFFSFTALRECLREYFRLAKEGKTAHTQSHPIFNP